MMQRFPSLRLATLGFLTAVVVLGPPPRRLFAEGREFSAQQHDLRLLVDTRWCGCRHGGYYPVRIRVTNVGPSRNLVFQFAPHDRRLPTVEKMIGAEQNATAQFTLSIPMSANGQYGTLTVRQNDVELKGLRWDFSLPDVSWNEPPRPSLLMISPTTPDATAYEQAVQARFHLTASGGYGRGYGAVSEDHQQIPPTMLPESWIDYSGLDLASVSLEALGGMNSAARNALIGWVESGGTLLVTHVGGPAADSEALRKLLSLDARAAVSKAWKSSDKAVFDAQANVPLDAGIVFPPGTTMVEPVPTEPSQSAPLVNDQEFLQEIGEHVWPRTEEAFQIRDVMRGRVVAFPKDPFPGTARDWLWLFSSLPADALRWTDRNGFSARRPNNEFLNFEIPGLRGVPVSAFLVLMSVFGLVIGPVNYFVLWKRKKLWMLVVTIPAIAFVTSVTLFGYSAVAHGFGVKSRTRSLTWLDQTTRTAISTARISLFAGLSPGRGLHFSPETSVMPVWSGASGSLEPGHVDWTESQQFDSQWLRSRTRVQFVTQSRRTERGRLVVGAPDSGGLRVENGFPWAMELLAVVDDQGVVYFGGPVPAGAAATLKRSENKEEVAAFQKEIARFPLSPPEGANYITLRQNSYSPYSPWTGSDGDTVSTGFSMSRMERDIAGILRAGGPTFNLYVPRTFIASFSDNPGIEMGLEKVTERGPLHLMIGKY